MQLKLIRFSAVVAVILCTLMYSKPVPANFQEMLQSTIGFSCILMGYLITASFIISAISQDTHRKIVCYFIFSIKCLFGLFISSIFLAFIEITILQGWQLVLFAGWLFSLILALISTYKSIEYLANLLKQRNNTVN